MNRIANEPVLTAASVTAVVVAFVNVLVLLEVVQWDADQVAGINAFVTATVALLFGVWARSRVTPI